MGNTVRDVWQGEKSLESQFRVFKRLPSASRTIVYETLCASVCEKIFIRIDRPEDCDKIKQEEACWKRQRMGHVISGSGRQWRNSHARVEKNNKVVGLQNDTSTIYLAIRTIAMKRRVQSPLTDFALVAWLMVSLITRSRNNHDTPGDRRMFSQAIDSIGGSLVPRQVARVHCTLILPHEF